MIKFLLFILFFTVGILACMVSIAVIIWKDEKDRKHKSKR